MDERDRLAEENGMTNEFVDWFFEEKKTIAVGRGSW